VGVVDPQAFDEEAAERVPGDVHREQATGLDSNRPRRGRRRTSESIQKRLVEIDEALVDADP
jgi:hypothetical protein